MKDINSLGLFDNCFLAEKLSKLTNPLEKLDFHIDWRIFEASINRSIEDMQNKEKKVDSHPMIG